MEATKNVVLGVVLQLLLLTNVPIRSNAQEMETVTGTIFCNNDFTFYVNGEQVATDPIGTIPHNSVNVTFSVQAGKDITFAIDARDLASDVTGLELDDKCVGSGGLRAMFSNGVVTNDQWVCSTYLYGPVNWRECFAAQDVRNFSLQLLPGCMADTTPPLEGCYTRRTSKPAGWTMPDFDESHWEYAIEWNDAVAGWGLPPEGCASDPNLIISPQTDPEGNSLTCPQNLDWGDAKFIWRPDLSLDNHLLCRFTLKQEDDSSMGSGVATLSAFNLLLLVSLIAAVILASVAGGNGYLI